MVTLPSLRYIRSQKNKWLAIQDLHSLQKLLRLSPANQEKLKQEHRYHLFSIPKKDGSQRFIEDPHCYLKQVQRRVNNYLQAVYYFFRNPASYGFCIRVKGDQHPCTIYTHALQHAGCRFLFNADLKDFFHTVTWQIVFDLFGRTPFNHNTETRNWICNLTTHLGRLPMGAPSSPVLSNLAATALDQALQALAQRQGLTYTRYADDLSFSSKDPITKPAQEEILQIISNHAFVPNPKKIKYFGLRDKKIVTGLQVQEKVSLGDAWWKKTNMLLDQQLALQCLLQQRPSISIYNQVADIKEKVNGYLAFAACLGDAEKNNLEKARYRLQHMEEEMEEFESLAWDEIPYQF